MYYATLMTILILIYANNQTKNPTVYGVELLFCIIYRVKKIAELQSIHAVFRGLLRQSVTYGFISMSVHS